MGLSVTLPAELLTVVGALVPLGLILFSFAVFFHPLRAYPGPFLAKITDAYGGYYVWHRCLHLRTYHDHVRYGPIFRQAPNRLVFSTAAALRDIYFNPNVVKAHVYKQSQFNPHANIFGTLDKERHRQKRKIYGQVLSDRSLRIFEPTMIEEIDVFLRQLLKARGEVVNMSPAAERLTADIAGQLAFGQPLNTQVEEKYRLFPRAMVSMNAIVSVFMAWPSVALLWPIIKPLNRKNNESFIQSIQEIIQSRMALDKDAKHDFYSIAAGDLDTAEGLQSTELWSEANFILPAGGTTLSAALSAIFFYLSRNPAVYARLAAEIRTTFTSGRAIQSGNQLKGLKYLRAVIDESMRMSPPFIGTLWRQPYSSYRGQFVVDGHVIPPETIVGVNPYCVMHNEAYFPEPFSFRPERWLDSGIEQSSIALPDAEAEQARSIMRAAFATFAFGETGCVGKAMAYQEMSLVVAKTLWYFNFETAASEAGRLGEGGTGKADGRGRKDEYQLFDMAVADHDGPNLVFRPRDQYWRDLGVTADEG